MSGNKVDYFNKNDYFVIKECLDTNYGYAGTLTFDGFYDETQKGYSKVNKSEYRIVAEGYMHYFEANRWLALTPEVCRFTAAIEKHFEQEISNFDGIRLDFLSFMTEAVEEIMEDRELRKGGEHPPPTTFPFVIIGTDNSLQTRLFRIVKDSCTNPEGRIDDLQSLIRKLSDERVIYTYKHLMEKLKR